MYSHLPLEEDWQLTLLYIYYIAAASEAEPVLHEELVPAERRTENVADV